jgi:hypothetical protein
VCSTAAVNVDHTPVGRVGEAQLTTRPAAACSASINSGGGELSALGPSAGPARPAMRDTSALGRNTYLQGAQFAAAGPAAGRKCAAAGRTLGGRVRPQAALDPAVKIFVGRKDNLISAGSVHIETNHADVYAEYKPTSQGKRLAPALSASSRQGRRRPSWRSESRSRRRQPCPRAQRQPCPCPLRRRRPQPSRRQRLSRRLGGSGSTRAMWACSLALSPTRSRLSWHPRPRRPLDQGRVCRRLQALVKCSCNRGEGRRSVVS